MAEKILQIPPSHIIKGSYIYKGNFGAIYQGKYKDKRIAIKQFFTKNFSDIPKVLFLEELRFLQIARRKFPEYSQNIQVPIGISYIDRSDNLISELVCDYNGYISKSLEEYLRKNIQISHDFEESLDEIIEKALFEMFLPFDFNIRNVLVQKTSELNMRPVFVDLRDPGITRENCSYRKKRLEAIKKSNPDKIGFKRFKSYSCLL